MLFVYKIYFGSVLFFIGDINGWYKTTKILHKRHSKTLFIFSKPYIIFIFNVNIFYSMRFIIDDIKKVTKIIKYISLFF